MEVWFENVFTYLSKIKYDQIEVNQSAHLEAYLSEKGVLISEAGYQDDKTMCQYLWIYKSVVI